MIGSSPSYYEEVLANEALREANEPGTRAEAGAVDILPFQALGGRRFEILTYLMLLDPPPPVGVTVSLVKASGDQGRDVITHTNGKLKSVIQCKALESPLSRPALIRELMKLAVHDSKQSFIPRDGIDYEIWAPGGLTGPAQKLIQECKAWVFADRLFGSTDSKAKELFRERENNLDQLLLSKLRYRVGDTVQVRAGDGTGTNGVIRKIHVRHKFAYEIEDSAGHLSSISDEQLD